MTVDNLFILYSKRPMITFGTSSFTFNQILKGDKSQLSPIYEEAFGFCFDWLNGKNDFTLQTSGSTGPPKNITVSRTQLIESAKATKLFFDLKEGCSMLCCLDTSKVAGKMMLVRAMEWGACLRVIPPESNPLKDLKNEVIDFVAFVPLQVEKMMSSASGKRALEQIHNIIIGGASISPQLREKVACLPGKVFQTYGMTETVSHIALANLKEKGDLKYKALPGVKLKVDEQNRLSIHAAMGGSIWLQTNDVVSLQSDTTFIWKGRSDHVVNSGGVKLYPEEIAQEMSELMSVYFPGKLFFLTGTADESLGQALILVVEGVGNNSNAVTFLKKARSILPKYHSPKQILFIPKFKVTPSGKIDQLRTLAK
ncbi:AMP-dependent synthetase and ligase [Cyclobacterium amurskyense]|uniref:AMP-dependent synthetase and ligase n=2 Tax=Cyclobacterium amurskyense TaxID=320787 RepID=A0A0H4PHY2_9BACT|nr:AMP-dependent synthetase and ligase [Cyclobacterium amurskyense]